MEIIGNLNLKRNTDLAKYYLPLYSGELACGLFGISEDYVENYLSLDEKFSKNRESTFFVRASGDSMNPKIENGDILIVDRSLKIFNGAIVAVFYNGTPMCKQLVLENKTTVLHSFNSSQKDIVVGADDELAIFGVVIGLAREFY